MSVVSVTEQWESQAMRQQLDPPRREYTRVFRVITDDEDDDGNVVLAAAGIPALGAPYVTLGSSDAAAFVKTREPSRSSDDPFVWSVTVTYDTDVPDPDDIEENPLDRPPKYKFSFTKYQQAVEVDLSGDPIVNSAGMPYLPPLEIDASRAVINISINKATFSFADILQLQDAVNADTWNGFPPKTVKCASVDVETAHENGVSYYAFNYTLEIKAEVATESPLTYRGWNPVRVLDKGFYTLNEDEELVLVTDNEGRPLNAPSLLDGEGGLGDEDAPVFLEFDCYREVNFTGLIP